MSAVRLINFSVSVNSSKAELIRKLKLAEIQIRRLELQVEDKRLYDEARSIATERSEPPVPVTTSVKMAAVQQYVESLPRKTETIDPYTRIQQPQLRRLSDYDEGRTHRFNDTAQLLQACMNLPNRPIVKFDGTPVKYHGFIRSFKSTVARYTDDPVTLLTYLISYCEGEAAEAIERCAILEPFEGYEEALRILERRFGEPHVIARTAINELTQGPLLKLNDPKTLVRLADTMKLCSATLKQLNYHSDLNSCHTLSAIVQRLPNGI